MTAKGCGATVLDRRHDLELGKAEMPGMSGPIGEPGSPEDVGDLYRGAQAQPGSISPCISTISRSSGPATAWIVRVESLV